MKKITKKLSAMALCTVFASMQIAMASMDTGLGNGLGGAVINHTEGGFAGLETGDGSATLNFNGNSHVNWDTLNVGNGETLNFNAVDGANGLTVVNTVNNGMSTIYGTITSNSGISKLIISNPNGMLFDGATFSTAGDLMLTTQALGVSYANGNLNIEGINQPAINGVTIKNSDFSVGGEFNIIAPSIEAIKTAIKADKGFKLITQDGQNFLVCPDTSNDEHHIAVRLESVSVDGNVYIVSGKDLVKIVNGGDITGDLNILSDGNVALNYTNNGEKLHVGGDVNVENDGRILYLRNADVDGNVTMSNSGGFLEVKDINVKGNVDLTTTDKTNHGVKHFVHVVGDNVIGGNLNIDSIHNIHIGGYDDELSHLAKGSLTVGGDINAHAREGSIAITADTTADKVSFTSDTLNIITDGKAVITANDYKFKAKYYIGGVDTQAGIIDTMENYKPIPTITKGTTTYLQIAGGNVSQIETDNGYAYIRSNGDMNVNGINSQYVQLASAKDIVIGKDNHADTIRVDGETRNLTVETAAGSRDYTLKYTNILNTEELTINPDVEITYNMANGVPNGWNYGTQTKENTYLIVPGEPTPQPPQDPDIPQPPQDNDNVKILNNLVKDPSSTAIDAGPVPVAFAADFDDEIETAVRKNVDGSVTVVRPFTPSN